MIVDVTVDEPAEILRDLATIAPQLWEEPIFADRFDLLNTTQEA